MSRRLTFGLAALVLAAVGQTVPVFAQTTPAGSAQSPALGDSSPSAWDRACERFTGYKADTKPSNDVVMKFSFSTEVREINVVGGQRVRKLDVLMRARDAEIKAAIEQQRVLADNDLEVQGAEKQLELATFRFNQLKSGGTYSPTEFEELRIQAETARVQRDQAKKNLEQQRYRLDQLKGQYERYYLEAPFDGIIEEVMIQVGQGVTEQDQVLRIVNTEKLWLDPYASTPETIRLNLQEGSPAWVLVDLPDQPLVVKGKVLYVSPVADSVSQTRRVRVEIANPAGWPAGTQARVRFTQPEGQWESVKTQQTSDAAPSASERSPRRERTMMLAKLHEGDPRQACDRLGCPCSGADEWASGFFEAGAPGKASAGAKAGIGKSKLVLRAQQKSLDAGGMDK